MNLFQQLTLLILLLHPVELLAHNTESQLIRDLLDNYIIPSARPVKDNTQNVTVMIRLIVLQVIELNEKRQDITVSAWYNAFWKDEFMVWDPNDYNNITEIFVEQSALWNPDVTLYNNVDNEFERTKKSLNLNVKHDGMVDLATPVILNSFCKMHLRHFPFDKQECALEFGGWVYNGGQQDLIPDTGHESKQTEFNQNGAWNLTDVSVQYIQEKYNCCPDVYPRVIYTLFLQRRERFFVEIILLPCCLLSILTMFVFLLPPESGEKMSFGVSTLLAILLFQQMIADALPPSADSAPILQEYFTMLTCMSCISIVCSAVLLNIYNCNQPGDIPKWLANVLFGKVGKAIGRKTSTNADERISLQRKKSGEENENITCFHSADHANCMCGGRSSIKEFDERARYISNTTMDSMSEELKLILNELRKYSNEYKREELNKSKKENLRNVVILVDRLLFVVLFTIVVIVTITVIIIISGN
ncbi:neuronal acetylcholine receptor subunit alpha-10-like [Antedon mediterranea]|uniref:neuronal acetylcholine receptor subunit alpha-10-like n=1 Tax=Antedon mediterranea TaxID=105859 RepID=UPI003AF4B59A